MKLEAKYEASDGTIFEEMEKWMEYEEKFENPGIPTIKVVGEDRRCHMAEVHKDTCLCGIKILSKKPDALKGVIYCCYECTY